MRFYGPFVTVCNAPNYFFTYLAEHFSEADSTGQAQRALLNTTCQDDSLGSIGADEPANGNEVLEGNKQYLHANPYGAAVTPDGRADCEAGQRGYLERNARATTTSASRSSRTHARRARRGRPTRAARARPRARRSARSPRPARTPTSPRPRAVSDEEQLHCRRRGPRHHAGRRLPRLHESIPFRSHYEVKAAFKSANNLRNGSPVRIAGVEVGKVTKVERGGARATRARS